MDIETTSCNYVSKVSDSVFFKVNGNLLNKHKNLFQISVHKMQNDLILTVSQGGFHVAINEDDRLFTGDNSLRKYAPKHIKLTSNISNITC